MRQSKYRKYLALLLAVMVLLSTLSVLMIPVLASTEYSGNSYTITTNGINFNGESVQYTFSRQKPVYAYTAVTEQRQVQTGTQQQLDENNNPVYQPVLDEHGDPVLDEQGSQVSEPVMVPVYTTVTVVTVKSQEIICPVTGSSPLLMRLSTTGISSNSKKYKKLYNQTAWMIRYKKDWFSTVTTGTSVT